MRPSLLLAAVLLLPATPPASAATGAMYGTGTFTPGVPATGCVNGLVTDIAGTMVTATGAHAFTYDAASDVCATVLADRGSGTLSGPGGGSGTYSRTLFSMTLSGPTYAWSCVLTPTDWNPWRSFVIVCVPGANPR